MKPPSRWWWDLSTREFDELDMGRVVAVLPVGAIEQHGPHLPLRVDAAINAGIVARAVELMPDDLPALVLPALPVGKSSEHLAFPGTLSLPSDLLARLLFEVAKSVWRAGVRRIVFWNSHGGLTAFAGYPIALSLLRVPARWKSVALVVLMTPLHTGEIVRIYASRLVLGTDGLANGIMLALHLVQVPVKAILFFPVATILMLFYDELPFMTLALWIAAEQLDLRLVETARDLGARPLAAFTRVTLPMTSTGLCAGALAVFALSAGDMQTPNVLGRPSGATVLASIDNFSETAFGWPTASALALSLLVALGAVAAVESVLILRVGGGTVRMRP